MIIFPGQQAQIKMGGHPRCGSKKVVVIFQNCHNRVAKMEWLKTTRVYFLTGLKVRNLKACCLLGHVPTEISREESFLAPSNSQWLPAILSLSKPSGHISPALLSCMFLCLYPNAPFIFLIKMSVIGFRAYPKPIWPILSTSAKTVFPNRIIF